MIDVVGVRFKEAGKIYYFAPMEFDLKLEDNVIVETARGVEFGTIVVEKRQVSEDEIVKTLKPIIRIANEDDKLRHKINLEKKTHALEVCEGKILDHGLPMKLIDMEYTFDNNKVIFYFTADGRVDFRELVRDLASYFKVRIELRQIGVRDHTKKIGGLAPCGRECCCKSFLGEFTPISITMAKNQGLSLNPHKISGLCGRLLCCLRYEDSMYEEALKGMPLVGDIVETADGLGTVVKRDPLHGTLRVLVNKGESNEKFDNYNRDDIKATGQRDKDYEEVIDQNQEPIDDTDTNIKDLED